MKKLITFSLLSLCFTTPLVSADAPQLINYQGKLYQADGSTPLATGDYDIQVEIYDDPEAGTKSWGPLTLSRTPVVKGFFNVLLGNDDSAAMINTAFATANAYLQITVDKEGDGFGDNTPILPRQQVLSTPYALQADSAKTLSDMSTVRPAGEVTAFALNTCPTGWSEYTAAYGRFIRGIDKSGSNIDADGERVVEGTQEDEVKSHAHSQQRFLYPSLQGTGDYYERGGFGNSFTTINTGYAGGAETRPKNVALLYCVKD